MQVAQIPIEHIELEDNIRKFIHEDRLAELCESIEEVGILQPIIVEKKADKYVLVTGLRRYRAAQMAGEIHINASIIETDFCRKQVQLIENLQREGLNPLERAKAIHEYISQSKLSKVDAANRLGVPRTTLTEWLDVLEVAPTYQQAVLDNYYGGGSPLSVSHISLVKRFAQKVNSPDIVAVALDTIIEYNLTRVETKKVLAIVSECQDVSLQKAVDKVRSNPKATKEQVDDEQWDVQRQVAYLSRSGHYLVKCQDDHIRSLNHEDKKELLRQARVLRKLLKGVMDMIN